MRRWPGISILIAIMIVSIWQGCSEDSSVAPDGGSAIHPWPSFHGNAHRTGQSRLPGPQVGEILWTKQLDWDIFSSPAVGNDGTIYVGTGEGYIAGSLHAISPTGQILWSYSVGASIESSPTVCRDGTILFGGSDSTLHALDKDGSVRWLFKAGSWIRSSPLEDLEGNIYFCCDDSLLYSLDHDGSLLWTFRLGKTVHGSPALSHSGTVYAYGRNLYAVQKDGSLKWEFEADSGPYRVLSSPAVGPDGTIYIIERDQLSAVGSDGFLRWHFPYAPNDFALETLRSPAVDNRGTVYFAYYRTMYAVSNGGKLVYAFALNPGRDIESSPAIDSDGTIYFGAAFAGSEDGNFYALRPSGDLRFMIRIVNSRGIAGDITSSPAITADGKIVVGSDNGSFGLALIN